jgi:hypothetical protein
MSRLINHVRRNAIAYVALFVALGGTSYAAFSLPPGSVGKQQIQNRAVDSSKLDPGSVAASVRAWANLTWAGGWRIQASSTDIRVATTALGEVIRWRRTRFAGNCMASVTPQRNVVPKQGGSFDGYVTTVFDGPSGVLQIDGLASNGASQPQSITVLIVCPSPGSQKVSR